MYTHLLYSLHNREHQPPEHNSDTENPTHPSVYEAIPAFRDFEVTVELNIVYETTAPASNPVMQPNIAYVTTFSVRDSTPSSPHPSMESNNDVYETIQ